MPYYEYKCGVCSKEIEIEQKITDKPIVECPLCLCATLKRQISSTTFTLKGGGWYTDGYSSPKTSSSD